MTSGLSAIGLFIGVFISYRIVKAYDGYHLTITHIDGSIDNYDNIYASVYSTLNEQDEIFKTNTIDCKTPSFEWNQNFNFQNGLQLIFKLYNINPDGDIQYLGQTKPLSTQKMLNCNYIYVKRMKLYNQYDEVLSNDIALLIEVQKTDCDQNSGHQSKSKTDSKVKQQYVYNTVR